MKNGGTIHMGWACCDLGNLFFYYLESTFLGDREKPKDQTTHLFSDLSKYFYSIHTTFNKYCVPEVR